MKLRVELGKTWACHNDRAKPCIGAIRALKEAGLSFKYLGDESLVDEETVAPFIGMLTE